MKKRLISAVLLVVLLCTMTAPAASAIGETADPRFTHTMSISALIQFNKLLGIAKCSGSVDAYANTPVKVIIRLQQQTDTGWESLITWEDTGTGSALAYGEYAVYRGYTYRVVATGYVYDNDGNLLEVTSASHSDYLPGLFG